MDYLIEQANEASRMKKMQVALVFASILVFLHMERTIDNFSESSNVTIASKPPSHPDTTTSTSPLSSPTLAPMHQQPSNSAGSQPISTIIGSIIGNPTPDTVEGAAVDPGGTGNPRDPDDSDANGNNNNDDDDDNDDNNDVNAADNDGGNTTISNATIEFENKTLAINYAYHSEGLSPQLVNYSRQNCDLSSLRSWYPESEEDSWEYRAPYFVIAGVWNSGSKLLAKKLYSHPQIAKGATRNNGFYMPSNFRKYQSPLPKVFPARKKMYAQAYKKGLLKSQPDMVAMDVAPGYIFYAEEVSRTLLCISPWIKIVILLRNPIDRLLEQYARAADSFRLRISLEQWIANEMALITSAGLIGVAPDSEEEQQAWKRYQKVPRMPNPIGRSLYIFQLKELFQTYKAAGKTPSKDIYIVPSEVLEQKESFPIEYNKLLSFLGLSTIPVDHIAPKPLSSESALHLTNQTRSMMRKFFKPYNRRLYTLLEEEDFTSYSWKQLWNSKTAAA